MRVDVLQIGVALFWVACAVLLLVAVSLGGFVVRAAGRADRQRRSLFRQELIWILTSALLVMGLAVATELVPYTPRSFPAFLAR